VLLLERLFSAAAFATAARSSTNLASAAFLGCLLFSLEPLGVLAFLCSWAVFCFLLLLL